MSATTNPAQDLLERTGQVAHPQCIVCGRVPERGLGLRFSLQDDGCVEACFACQRRFQGYEDLLHGGVASSLLDGAMTNCLFAHGIVAVTAEMTVRFRHPIALEVPLMARAHVTRSQAPLHVVEAQLVQAGQVKATAVGKFMERPPGHDGTSAAVQAEEQGPGMPSTHTPPVLSVVPPARPSGPTASGT